MSTARPLACSEKAVPPVIGRQTNAVVLLVSPVGGASRSATVTMRISSIGNRSACSVSNTETMSSATDEATMISPVWLRPSKPRNDTVT